MASLRMYNEAATPAEYSVRVAGLDNAAPDGLAARLTSVINPKAEPWLSFSRVASECVEERMKVLRDEIAGD